MEIITDDLHDIAKRLCEIDIEYSLYRNHQYDRYEVWWRDKFSFVIPFDLLDERTLSFTRQTRRENADKIEQDINESNERLEQDRQNKLTELEYKLTDMLRYANTKEYEVTFGKEQLWF